MYLFLNIWRNKKCQMTNDMLRVVPRFPIFIYFAVKNVIDCSNQNDAQLEWKKHETIFNSLRVIRRRRLHIQVALNYLVKRRRQVITVCSLLLLILSSRSLTTRVRHVGSCRRFTRNSWWTVTQRLTFYAWHLSQSPWKIRFDGTIRTNIVYALFSAHEKFEVWNTSWIFAEYSTGAVEYSTQAADNSKLPIFMVSDVALLVQIIHELCSVHEKCDVWTGPNCARITFASVSCRGLVTLQELWKGLFP